MRQEGPVTQGVNNWVLAKQDEAASSFGEWIREENPTRQQKMSEL